MSSQISILISCKCTKSKDFCMHVPNQERWKPRQWTASDMTQEKKKGNAEKVSSALILYSHCGNTKSLLIIHYMFWPIWPSSGKYKNMQNTWDVNCNINFCKKKFNLIF